MLDHGRRIAAMGDARYVHKGYVCLALFGFTLLYGQTDLATVTGIVTDSTKARMAGVVVTIRNTNTNITRSTTTNPDGNFAITELPPGPYELTASLAGFNTYRESKIVLETGQQLRNDIEMKIGAVSETVNVSADIAPLNTEDGAVKGAVVVQQEIQDVPLNGRDFTDIAFLVPGVVPKAQNGQGSGMSVNGARADNTNFYVDGFDDRNARGAAAQLRPNIDAMEEFKMETSGFSAQYGKMAGGVMNMILKSGTNQLHGTAFEYFRNDVVDARSFFDPVRAPLHQNQFGATFTGPVVLPKLYNGRDKTFFMISEETYLESDGETRLNNVPTLLERAGDFSQVLNVRTGKPITIKDPFNKNVAFPGDTIPVSRFSPVAVNLTKFYPLPNYTSIGNNYQASELNWSNWASILGKMDHRFSDSDSISVRYGYRWNPNNNPWAGTDLGGFQTIVSDNRAMGGITYTHMVSPTTINELRVGFSRNSEHEHQDTSLGQPTAAGLGMAGSTTDPLLAGFPHVNVTNYASMGFAANEPLSFFVTDYQPGDVLTWVKGKHVLKFGVDISIDQFNQPYYNNSRGTFTANGVWTGNGTAANGDAFGDLLLGLLNASTITANPTRSYLRWMDYGAFVNDDFKVTDNLTLNLGLRYEIDQPPHDKYDRLINFVPSLDKIIVASDKSIPGFAQLVQQAGLTGRVGLASQYGLPNSLVFTPYTDFAPRFGFAWRPKGTQSTVIRGGYGWFYSGSVLNDIRGDLGTSFPFSTNYSFARVASNVNALALADPWPVAIATLAGTNTSNGFQVHAPMGYLQSYNLTIEHDLGRGNVVEIGYVGSKGTHLGRRYNVNQPYRSIAEYQASGTNFPAPYPPLGTINYYDFGSNSIYNAAQFILRRRATGNLFYQLGYTYSKSIDDASQLSGASDGGFGGALDARNLALERARSDFDRGHVFTAVFSYPLPVGRGRSLLSNRGGMLDGLFGGWQLSGTVTAATGQAFTIEDSSVNAAIGESTRPNRIASGKDVSGPGAKGLDFPWYDPNVFSAVPGCASRTNCSPDQYGFIPFVPGNSGRNILDGPSLFYINTTVFKNFHVGEHRFIEARWEVFNILNRPNFQLPDRNFNDTSAGIISGVQDAGRGGPRVLQFAIKFIF